MAFSKYTLAAAALLVVARASPAPQAPDFAAVTAAPSVADGPSNNGDGDQTASLLTTFNAPAASDAPAAPTARGLSKRTFWNTKPGCTCPWTDPFCVWSAPECPTKSPPNPPKPTSPPNPPKQSSPPKPSTTWGASTTTPPAVTTAPLPSCPTSSYTPYYPALSTGYTTNPALTGTKTSTAPSSCPTTPENGTYCGFINPEDPCSPQPDGYGPVPSPDTADAFLNDPELHALAQKAPTTVPSIDNTEYQQVFKDLNAATSAQSYLGLRTLDSYDVKECAALCDCTDLCTAFNM